MEEETAFTDLSDLEFVLAMYQDSWEKVRLPRKFAELLDGREPRELKLREASGGRRLRDVEVVFDGDGHMYLGRGWDQFAREYGVQPGHFLVFSYDGHAVLTIKVFDGTMCRRHYHYQHDDDDDDASTTPVPRSLQLATVKEEDSSTSPGSESSSDSGRNNSIIDSGSNNSSSSSAEMDINDAPASQFTVMLRQCHLGAKQKQYLVFTFGSGPLKTYLQDGDTDVTIFTNSEELKDTWTNLVRDALEQEEKNENAELCVKEVQYIQAEVKVIKCLVDNIVVDISFNQVGGLCTLCFLEQAWCFYESRVLGAHHGLISTYALETLVLYTFHVFNNCFTGPLEVLYRFLEFFSNFDWEKFCLSLWGPVPINSLPEMTADPPRMDTGDFLLSKAFLDRCRPLYGLAARTLDNQGQPFVPKHFNIIDPLRTNKNLGRSVSKGNYFRIRSAFSLGAKRLAKLLECPNGDVVAEVNQFFTNTLTRHESGNRPDVSTSNLSPEHALQDVFAEASNSHESATMTKNYIEKSKLRASQDSLTEGSHSSHPQSVC